MTRERGTIKPGGASQFTSKEGRVCNGQEAGSCPLAALIYCVYGT